MCDSNPDFSIDGTTSLDAFHSSGTLQEACASPEEACCQDVQGFLKAESAETFGLS